MVPRSIAPRIARQVRRNPKSQTTNPPVQATPVLNMETFMQQAVQALRQLEAHPPRSDAAPHAQPPQPQPEGLSTASQQPPVPHASAAPASFAPNPSVKRLVIRSASCFPVSGPQFPTPSSGSPNSGVGKCQESGFGKPRFSARK